MKRMESAEKRSRSNGSSVKKKIRTQYAVCVKNENYPASLELRKLYAVIPDRSAARVGLRRIVDESGEDYLYPADYFVDIKLPVSVAEIVRLAY
jgi:hypothetical protein